MDAKQITELLAHLKDEYATLGNAIASLERYLAIRANAPDVDAAPSAQQQRLIPPGGNGENPTAPKGTVSIRSAIAAVLKEAQRPMHAKEIWEQCYKRGARTAAKRPEAIVALSSVGIDNVKKVGPRIFQWDEA